MAIPQTFQLPPTAIATFDFDDINEGTGVVNYQGAIVKIDTTETFILTKNTSIFSNTAFKIVTALNVGGGFTMDGDFDFDLSPFAFPRDLIGTAYFSIPVSTTGSDLNNYLIIKLKKNDVVIGSVQTEAFNGQASEQFYQRLVSIPVTTPVHFNKGDVLRVTVEIWTNLGSGAGTTKLWADPANSVTSGETTRFQSLIPFRIDV